MNIWILFLTPLLVFSAPSFTSKHFVKELESKAIIPYVPNPFLSHTYLDAQENRLETLPLELQEIIAAKLLIGDILNLSESSKTLQQLCQDQTLWRLLVQRDFPDMFMPEEMPEGGWKAFYRDQYEITRSEFAGLILGIDEGSSAQRDPHSGKPTYLLVRIIASKDLSIPIDSIVMFHPDKYVRLDVDYGKIVLFNKLTNPSMIVRGQRLRLLMNVHAIIARPRKVQEDLLAIDADVAEIPNGDPAQIAAD